MYCTQCGNPNPDGANHCVVCGAQLVGASAPAEPVVATQQPVEPQTTEQNFASNDSYQTPAMDTRPEYSTNNYSQQPNNNYYSAPQPQELPAKGLGTASFIMGICSFLLCLGCFMPVVPIASIVMGAIAKSKAKAVGMKNSKATIGIVLSIIAFVSAIVAIVLYYVFIILAAASATTPSYDAYDYYYYFINNFMM